MQKKQKRTQGLNAVAVWRFQNLSPQRTIHNVRLYSVDCWCTDENIDLPWYSGDRRKRVKTDAARPVRRVYECINPRTIHGFVLWFRARVESHGNGYRVRPRDLNGGANYRFQRQTHTYGRARVRLISSWEFRVLKPRRPTSKSTGIRLWVVDRPCKQRFYSTRIARSRVHFSTFRWLSTSFTWWLQLRFYVIAGVACYWLRLRSMTD